MKTTTPACTAPGSWSCGMMCAQTASTVRASSTLKKRHGLFDRAQLTAVPVRPATINLRRSILHSDLNDVRTDGFHRARLFHTQETPRAFRPRATHCGSGRAHDDKPPAIHPTD